jgi:hypothetical protein
MIKFCYVFFLFIFASLLGVFTNSEQLWKFDYGLHPWVIWKRSSPPYVFRDIAYPERIQGCRRFYSDNMPNKFYKTSGYWFHKYKGECAPILKLIDEDYFLKNLGIYSAHDATSEIRNSPIGSVNRAVYNEWKECMLCNGYKNLFEFDELDEPKRSEKDEGLITNLTTKRFAHHLNDYVSLAHRYLKRDVQIVLDYPEINYILQRNLLRQI